MAERRSDGDNKIHYLSEALGRKARTLRDGDGGGTSDGMDPRVTRLEEWAKLSETRSARMEDKLDTIVGQLAQLPSRSTLLNYFIGAVGIGLAILAAILGGLAYLDGRDAKREAPAPIIVMTPATPAAPTPPATPAAKP